MFTGPNIVRDGLVLHLDAANEKSFRGEPTTNVVANPQPTTSWGVSNFGGSAATLSYLTENGVPFIRYTSVISISGYPRFVDSVFPNSATITGSFSTSFEARGTSGAQLWLRIYENGSTKITNVATLTSEWVRYKFENQTTAFNLNQPYFHPFTTDATYDIRNIQIEAKPYATPFVNGTRGTTVATGGGWADKSGSNNHGTLVNGPTYSSDGLGGVVFGGGEDRINVINPGISQTFTVSAWVKCSNVSTSNNIVSKNGPYFMRIVNSKVRFNVNTDTGWLFQNGTTTLSNNVWYYFSMTYDSSFFKGYINSVLEFSAVKTGSIISNSPLYIGYTPAVGEQAGFNGNISQVKIYNRALTAEEVLQNYEATKSRFNL